MAAASTKHDGAVSAQAQHVTPTQTHLHKRQSIFAHGATNGLAWVGCNVTQQSCDRAKELGSCGRVVCDGVVGSMHNLGHAERWRRQELAFTLAAIKQTHVEVCT
mgnify:CR=1 FL=1